MAYCTKQDMIDRFSEQELIQLTDINGLALIDEVILNTAISDATDFIDDMLKLYVLPLLNQYPDFIRLSCDIARYYLYKNTVTPEVKERFEYAKNYFQHIKTGENKLLNEVRKTEWQNLAQMQSEGNVFGRNSIY